MPASAIETGCIDFVLTPEGIAKQIMKLAQGVSSPSPDG
jgi:chemotaxis response regulator CheB